MTYNIKGFTWSLNKMAKMGQVTITNERKGERCLTMVSFLEKEPLHTSLLRQFNLYSFSKMKGENVFTSVSLPFDYVENGRFVEQMYRHVVRNNLSSLDEARKAASRKEAPPVCIRSEVSDAKNASTRTSTHTSTRTSTRTSTQRTTRTSLRTTTCTNVHTNVQTNVHTRTESFDTVECNMPADFWTMNITFGGSILELDQNEDQDQHQDLDLDLDQDQDQDQDQHQDQDEDQDEKQKERQKETERHRQRQRQREEADDLSNVEFGLDSFELFV